MEVLFEFFGGPLDGEIIMKKEWPLDQPLPGTEILDKSRGNLYRYHNLMSVKHPVYTYRPRESARN